MTETESALPLMEELGSDGNAAKYLIFRPEKVGIFDVFRLLFTKRRFLDYHSFVQSSNPPISAELEGAVPEIYVIMSAMLLKVLYVLRKPLALLGRMVEYCLNLLCLNDGYMGFLRNIVSGYHLHRRLFFLQNLLLEFSFATDLLSSS